MKVSLLNHSNALYNREKVADAAAAICVDKYDEACEFVDSNQHMLAAIESGHLSVIEHLPLTFLVEDVSRSLTHQLVRHRIASYSQQSQRYAKVDTNGEWYVVPKSIGYSKFYEDYHDLMLSIETLYKKMCETKGHNGYPIISKEDARYILPNACHTSIIVSMNARAFVEVCKLRLCKKAQWEIRELFAKMKKLIEFVYPNIYALCVPNCVTIGCQEMNPCYREY